MSCRNFEEKYNLLRSCGCRRCYEEAHRLRHAYETERYHRDQMDAISYSMLRQIPMTYTKDLKVTETPKVAEEPKNMAVKLLVDKLKYEQSLLTGHEANIVIYKKSLSDYNSKKTSTQKNIKELAAALKKLGHKE